MLRSTRPDHRTFPRVRLLASCATSAGAGLGLTGSDPRRSMTHPAFRIGALAILAALGLSLTACATDPVAIPPNESRRGMSPAAGEPIATMSVTPATPVAAGLQRHDSGAGDLGQRPSQHRGGAGP